MLPAQSTAIPSPPRVKGPAILSGGPALSRSQTPPATYSRLPSGSTVRPLQPLPSMKVSHRPVAGSHAIMSPGPAAPSTKLENRNILRLATQVGPSFQSYLNGKSLQISVLAPGAGAGKGPGA